MDGHMSVLQPHPASDSIVRRRSAVTPLLLHYTLLLD